MHLDTKSFWFDLHCDALSSVRRGTQLVKRRRRGHFDLPRMIQGGITCEVLSIFVHPKFIPAKLRWRFVEKQVSRLREAVEAAPDKWTFAKSIDDVENALSENRRALVLEIEGLHPIEDNPALLNKLWEFGVRIYTLTWNNSNKFAHSCMETCQNSCGLKPDGVAIVKEIDKMGGIIDLSHSSEKTFYDVVSLGISPIFSHSCVRELCDSKRNATRDMIRILKEAGGIIGINLFPGFLAKERYSDVTSENVVRHIEACIEVGGEDIVAIGSDFDGVNALPVDIPDASAFWKIADAMRKRGFSEKTIQKTMGENFSKFWRKRSKG